MIFKVFPIITPPKGFDITTSPATVVDTPGVLAGNHKMETTEKLWGSNSRKDLEVLVLNVDFVNGRPARKDVMGMEARGAFFAKKAWVESASQRFC